jgi:hypothetical protein
MGGRQRESLRGGSWRRGRNPPPLPLHPPSLSVCCAQNLPSLSAGARSNSSLLCVSSLLTRFDGAVHTTPARFYHAPQFPVLQQHTHPEHRLTLSLSRVRSRPVDPEPARCPAPLLSLSDRLWPYHLLPRCHAALRIAPRVVVVA